MMILRDLIEAKCRNNLNEKRPRSSSKLNPHFIFGKFDA